MPPHFPLQSSQDNLTQPSKTPLFEVSNNSPDETSTDHQVINIKSETTAASSVSCRICFEEEVSPESGRLIHPCACSGTLAYIHENCLKEWILSKESKPFQCELCHCHFNMEMDIKENYSFWQFKKEGWQSFIFAIIVLMGMVIFMGIIIALWKVSVDRPSDEAPRKSITLCVLGLTLCIFLESMMAVTAYFLIKEAFLVRSVDWHIGEKKEDIDN